MKGLRGERGINGRILKVLFHKRLWCAQIFRTYTTLCNHDAKTLSASPKYAAMERFIFPGNRFSYNMESVPNEVISIVIQLGGKWFEYFALNALMNSSSLRLYSSSIFDSNFAWRTGFEKARNLQTSMHHTVKKGYMLSVYGLQPLFFNLCNNQFAKFTVKLINVIGWFKCAARFENMFLFVRQ